MDNLINGTLPIFSQELRNVITSHSQRPEKEEHNPEEHKSEEDECTICGEIITKNDVKTKCKHKFHLQCIQSWLNRRPSCPNCRAYVNVNQLSKIGGKSRHKKRGWRRTKKQHNKHSKKQKINLTKKQLNFTKEILGEK